MTYTFHRSSTAYGLETGTHYSFDEGDEVDAPEGEFDHLSDEVVTTQTPSELDTEEPPADAESD